VKDAQNEIRMLKTFNGHPNIIRLLDQASTQKGNGQTLCYMLFPVYRMGTAWDLIEQHTKAGGEGRWPFSEIQCLDIILGTVRALGAMHDATYVEYCCFHT
jgi:serine/threonine protein kinase